MFKKLAMAAIISCSFVATTYVSADDMSLAGTAFNFNVKSHTDSAIYKPLAAFVSNGKTYIKFSPEVTKNNMPLILVNRHSGNPIPEISWQSDFMVIDQPTTQIEIMDPKTQSRLFSLKLSQDFDYASVPPSPYILPSEYAGSFVSFGLGAATIDNKGFGFAGQLALGMDKQISGGLLGGFELGYEYDAKHTSDSVEVKSWNINLMARAQYLFQSGWNVIGKIGGAYVNNSDSGNDSIGNSVAPRVGLAGGYVFANNLALQLEYDYLISTSKVNSVSTISIGMTYHF
ncbi:MAG: outer membrane beta-barrel protein [Francisellaceae bacterium]